MERIRSYQLINPMECLAGDTPDQFHVRIIGQTELSGLSMHLLVMSEKNPDKIVLQKTGTPVEDGFTVQLTTQDTAPLCGVYYLDFVIAGTDGRLYKKLRCVLTVVKSARGAG